MRLTVLLACTAILAACGGGQSGGAVDARPGGGALPAQGAAVAQGEPNKADAQPASAEQTRAPGSKSGVALKVETIADGIDQPWGSAILPDDGRVLVTSKASKLWLVAPGKAKTEITGVPKVHARAQGGLLDISVDPDFMIACTVYFTFSEARGGGKNAPSLGKATLSADSTKLENVSTTFRQEPAWASTAHYGSNMEWDASGNLYLTLGERSDREPRELAQDLNTHLGKVVKLKPDGTPADGNPFIGQSNAKPEIWSYGHRNVQGAAIHPDTGKLWTIEHGPRGGDKINMPEAGKTYGRPVIGYGIEYAGGSIDGGITAQDGMEQPI